MDLLLSILAFHMDTQFEQKRACAEGTFLAIIIDGLQTHVAEKFITTEAPDFVCAVSCIVAGCRQAIINVDVTVFPLVAGVAVAVVARHHVPAGALEAGVRPTVIRVRFTIHSLEASRTGAGVGVHSFAASPSILARRLH